MCKVFPDLLLATMDILYNQYKQLKGKDGGAMNNEYKERVSYRSQLLNPCESVGSMGSMLTFFF